MRRTFALILTTSLTFGAVLTQPHSAHAQRLVYDPLNHIENILSALRAFIQIQNELQMLLQLKDGLDPEKAQYLIGVAVGSISRIVALTDQFANSPAYEAMFGAASPGSTPSTVTSSWAQSRNLGHETTQGTFKLLAQQLPIILGQAQQIRQAVAVGRSQEGIVGAVQSTVEIMSSVGNMLNTIEVFNAQHLRLQAARDSRELQKEERGLAAFQIQSAPLQVTPPPSRLRSLFQ